MLLISFILGNNQKKAKTIIEACQHKMIAVEDFNDAAKTVSDNSRVFICFIFFSFQAVNVAKISELARDVNISVEFSSL